MFRTRIKLYSYHTFLVIPFVVVFLYAQNLSQTRFAMTYRTLGFGMLLTLVLFGLAYLVLRNRLKTGVFVSLLLFAMFQYGVVYEFFERLYYAGRWPLSNIHRYLVFVYVLGFVCFFVWMWRSKREFVRANLFLNVLVAVLLLYNLVRIATTHVSIAAADRGELDPAEMTHFSDSLPKPNIYYIILDGYASGKTLQKYFNHDNHEFENWLKSKDFAIKDSACSNYYYTSNSLASTLNMEFLTDSVVPNRAVYNNRLFSILKANGYRIYHLFSGFAVTNAFAKADSTLNIGGPNEFEKSVLKYTVLRLDDLIGLFARERLKNQFEKMMVFPQLKTAPRFSFLHFVAPHPPFVFDRTGQLRTKQGFAEHSWEPAEHYVDQLLYVNSQMKILLDEIIKQDPGAVIIVQSDHGPWITGNSREELFESRSGILYAVYPSRRLNVPRRTSSVNTFRFVLNDLFLQQLPILADEQRGRESLMNDPILLKKVNNHADH